jgi:hypothetical protein
MARPRPGLCPHRFESCRIAYSVKMRANVTDNNLSYVWPWEKVYPPRAWCKADVPTKDTFLAIRTEESSLSTKLLQEWIDSPEKRW